MILCVLYAFVTSFQLFELFEYSIEMHPNPNPEGLGSLCLMLLSCNAIWTPCFPSLPLNDLLSYVTKQWTSWSSAAVSVRQQQAAEAPEVGGLGPLPLPSSLRGHGKTSVKPTNKPWGPLLILSKKHHHWLGGDEAVRSQNPTASTVGLLHQSRSLKSEALCSLHIFWCMKRAVI